MNAAPAEGATPAVLNTLVTRLAQLRRVPGADPLRLHYLEALCRRLPTATGAVRALLAQRIVRALADAERGAAERPAPQGAQAGAVRRPGSGATDLSDGGNGADRAHAPGPIAALNLQLQALASGARPGPRLGHAASDSARELRSVRRFRQSWSRLRAEQRVAQALRRGPENAGPLNSHSLVLQSLALMQRLSPDYLQRFLVQVDSLLWLEQAAVPERGRSAARASAASGFQDATE